MEYIVYKKGHIFNGPNGAGYVATRDLRAYEMILSSDFEPIGGAKKPVYGEAMEPWLSALLYKAHK